MTDGEGPSIPGLGEDPDREGGRDHDGVAPGLGDADRESGGNESGPGGGDRESGRSDRDSSGTEDEGHGEVEPVEVLVRMAEDGEIDPWDIDIVTVTDEFLARIDEADLRTSGRALFYASVLLRMKGDELLADEDPEEEAAPEPWEEGSAFGRGMAPGPGPAPGEGEDGEFDGFDPVEGLEAEMERRLERKRARGTPETLDELVRELREAERDTWWKESREYDTGDSPQGYARGTQTLDYRAGDDLRAAGEPTEADVTGTAHAEDIEATVATVQSALRRHYDQGREEVLFAEVRDAAGSVVETYLGLLFLSHRGHVRLQQDELFGDLWVQDPAAGGGESRGVAD